MRLAENKKEAPCRDVLPSASSALLLQHIATHCLCSHPDDAHSFDNFHLLCWWKMWILGQNDGDIEWISFERIFARGAILREQFSFEPVICWFPYTVCHPNAQLLTFYCCAMHPISQVHFCSVNSYVQPRDMKHRHPRFQVTCKVISFLIQVKIPAMLTVPAAVRQGLALVRFLFFSTRRQLTLDLNTEIEFVLTKQHPISFWQEHFQHSIITEAESRLKLTKERTWQLRLKTLISFSFFWKRAQRQNTRFFQKRSCQVHKEYWQVRSSWNDGIVKVALQSVTSVSCGHVSELVLLETSLSCHVAAF